MRNNEHHREILTKLKDDNTMRLYFQNINGGLKKDGWSKFRYVVKRLKEKNVEFIGLAETNIPWTPNDIKPQEQKY